MEFTKDEKKFIELYKNYSHHLKNTNHFNELDTKWTRDCTKEKKWVEIYNKTPIDPSLESILFKKEIDYNSVIEELDSIITKT